MVEALKAALTSWPRVEFVRMERRWRGLKTEAVEAGMMMIMMMLLVGRSSSGRGVFFRYQKACEEAVEMI